MTLDELVRENAEAPDREFLREAIRAYIEARFGPLILEAEARYSGEGNAVLEEALARARKE